MNHTFAQEPEASPVYDHSADSSERLWATLMHLGAFSIIVWGPLSILVPLVIWLAKRDESPYLDDHGREAVNFQISVWIWMTVSTVLILCGIGIFMIIGLVILWPIIIIVNAVRANRGQYIRYPITIRFFN